MLLLWTERPPPERLPIWAVTAQRYAFQTYGMLWRSAGMSPHAEVTKVRSGSNGHVSRSRCIFEVQCSADDFATPLQEGGSSTSAAYSRRRPAVLAAAVSQHALPYVAWAYGEGMSMPNLMPACQLVAVLGNCPNCPVGSSKWALNTKFFLMCMMFKLSIMLVLVVGHRTSMVFGVRLRGMESRGSALAGGQGGAGGGFLLSAGGDVSACVAYVDEAETDLSTQVVKHWQLHVRIRPPPWHPRPSCSPERIAMCVCAQACKSAAGQFGVTPRDRGDVAAPLALPYYMHWLGRRVGWEGLHTWAGERRW